MFAKLLFAGLGWAIAGPIGAFIGYAIGSSVEGISKSLPSSDNATYNQQRTNYTQTSGRTRTTQGDIQASLLVLISCVMKVDGHVKKSELDAVKRFLVHNYGEQNALEALQLLKKLLDQNIDYVPVAQQIRTYANYSTRLTIVQFLVSLANADGDFDSREEQMIRQMSASMGISAADCESLITIYKPKKEADWAYKVLEITKDASDEDVKKAYRRMAMKYHPDKVASAGEEIKQKATEKFRAINEAYEHIKTIRGIK